LFERKGHLAYSGEPVTQLEHALQSAFFAEKSGADSSLISACLLHDLGHLLNDQGETPSARGIDDTHQFYAIPFLRGVFGPSVLEPVRLHVDAKRYLCRSRSDYWSALSPDSKRSLELQGGMFSPSEAEAFTLLPHANEAVQLRLWDDMAKVAGSATPSLAHFAVHMRACALPVLQDA
jgi:phosphonate degradation associated HDIG domain protein